MTLCENCYREFTAEHSGRNQPCLYCGWRNGSPLYWLETMDDDESTWKLDSEQQVVVDRWRKSFK